MHSLNLTSQSAGGQSIWTHLLTGRIVSARVCESCSGRRGFDVANEPDGKMGQQFISIGGKFKPIGKPVCFCNKDGFHNDQPKAAIDRFRCSG